jgi:DNA replication protein DnaC
MNEAPREIELPSAEQLSSFVCPDRSGVHAPCSRAPQRFGPEFYPRILLADDRVDVCPVWLSVRCALYEKKYDEWVEVGRDRGLKERFVDASLISSRRTPALDVVAEFMKDAARRGRALTLLGPPGVGKTWAASAAVHAWPTPRGPVSDPLYLEVGEFVRDLLRWDRAERRQHPLDVAIEACFLALDDVGVGFLKKDGFAAASLEELLHSRHAAELPTIIVSNWSPKELARHLSARTVDRLKEWGNIIELDGPSLREAE